MTGPRPEPTVFFVRVAPNGFVRSMGRTTRSGFSQVLASFPNEQVLEITEAEAKLWRGQRTLRMVDGVLKDGGSSNAPATLEGLRRRARLDIDRDADAACARFMLGGVAQALDHLLTLDEAISCLDMGEDAEEEAYPMLAAERAVRRFMGQDETLLGVARDVVSHAQLCRVGLSQIKRVRRIAQVRVAVAPGEAEIRAVLDGLVWPQPVVA